MKDQNLEYTIGFSGPEGGMVEIVDGKVFFSDGSNINMPQWVTLDSGWGVNDIEPYLEPFQFVPIKLEVTYFSVFEKKFYQGSFILSRSDLTNLLTKGIQNTVDEFINPLHLTIGLAPQGDISFWVSNHTIQREALYVKARAVELDFNQLYTHTDYNKYNYATSLVTNPFTGAILDYTYISHPSEFLRLEKEAVISRTGLPILLELVKVKSFNGERTQAPLGKPMRIKPFETLIFNWKYEELSANTILSFGFNDVFNCFQKIKADKIELELEFIYDDLSINLYVKSEEEYCKLDVKNTTHRIW